MAMGQVSSTHTHPPRLGRRTCVRVADQGRVRARGRPRFSCFCWTGKPCAECRLENIIIIIIIIALSVFIWARSGGRRIAWD
ncbi:hypothetical protein LY76DRAFT_326214 [Colletotrichum caudatum]|nr:hypothetical protein LY76DRAFT_326214 [Colletotrichum caudatum]